MTEDSILHRGHRQRMRNKLLSHGSKVLETHELLEMLLYHVIPLKNTNPIAKRLIDRFGGIDGVFSASLEELCSVDGIGPAVAKFIIGCGIFISEKEQIPSDNPFDDYTRVGDFLVEKLSGETEYKTAMMLFDNRMRFIDYAVIYDFDYSSAAVKPDALIEFAIKRRASIAVTAHTHPHGPLFPTAGDMATNSAVCSALNRAGISHAEHYIISGDRFLGVTHQIKLAFVQSPELERFYKTREDALGG